MVRIAALLVAAALVVMPAAAVAATPNPFIPQPEPAPPQEAPPPAPVQQAPVDDETSTQIDSGTLTLVAIGMIGLIGGIWFVIARDARRATASRVRARTARDDPAALPQGRSSTRAGPRSRKQSPAERRRRKRGRAR